MFDGNAETEHTEFTHFFVDLAGNLSIKFPLLAMWRDLTLHKLNSLVIDGLEFVGHVDVSVGHCAVLSSMFFIRYHWSI